MAEDTIRTFMCAVAAIDLVGYSKQAVSEQLRLRDAFAASLLEGTAHVQPDKRIMIDTGGGAMISFLGDPEDALFTVLQVHAAMQSAYAGEYFERAIRACVNLGPVVLSKDLNGRPLTIGDGVNAARKIMRCTDPGEVTVSRSYHDLIARLSVDNAASFRDGGSRTDEESRAHEIYVVDNCEHALRLVQRRLSGG